MAKKVGVKKVKNGKQPNAFLAQLESDYQTQSNIVHEANTMICRQQMLDKVYIALADMGFNPDDIAEFQRVFCDVESEFCYMCTDDAKDDEQLWYFKKKLDDKLREIVKPEMFVEYDIRYGVYEMVLEQDKKRRENA